MYPKSFGGIVDLDQAIKELSNSVRDELIDHAFGDREITWTRNGVEIASGYSGSEGTLVTFTAVDEGKTFQGREALALTHIGTPGNIEFMNLSIYVASDGYLYNR